jgi:hypothetical protein
MKEGFFTSHLKKNEEIGGIFLFSVLVTLKAFKNKRMKKRRS